ncbi:MAG: universal stress protein [Acidobacteriota bacterium]
MQIASVLCPVDFSEHSDRALAVGLGLASAFGAHVTVLAVNDALLDAAARAAGRSDVLARQTQDELRALLQRHQALDGSPWTVPAVSVQVGDPAEVIVATAGDYKSDVIVMGTEGLGGPKKFLLGSTTERVLRMAASPVLAVPAGPSRVRHGAEGIELRIGRVLVAVDVEHPLGESVAAAGMLARRFRVPVQMLAVVPESGARGAWKDTAAAAADERRTRAKAALDALVPRLGEGVEVDVEVRAGRPADQITQAAAERGCGLIVMGSGTRHRPGTTAYRVLCQADVPVLAVPAAG